jgi:hypothetical protein
VSVQARTALAVSTSTTASWKLAHTSATGTGSAAACRASTQRATAVLRPAEGHVVGLLAQHRAGEGDGVAVALARPAVDDRAAREAEPEQPGDLVERLPRRVVDGGPSGSSVCVTSSTRRMLEWPPETSTAIAGCGSGPVLEDVDGDVGGGGG